MAFRYTFTYEVRHAGLAKGKPLTLMYGANLLYLLEKHGRKAKIDIREAKKILGEKGIL